MHCVHAHVGVEYILLSLVALLHSWHVRVYAYDRVVRVLTSEFLLAALGHKPLEEVRKLFLCHVFLWSGVTSEVDALSLLVLDVGPATNLDHFAKH